MTEFKASPDHKLLHAWEDFPAFKISYPDLLHDLPDVKAALSAGTDLVIPSSVPDLHSMLIPATLAILDAAGNIVVAAHPGLARYEFTAAGDLTANSRKELASDVRDLARRIIVLQTQAATAMSRALKSLDTPIRDSLANFDKARFTRILDANLSYSLLAFMEEVANQGSSANGTAALFALLKPDYAPSVSPDQLIRIYNDNGDKVTALLCSPATPNFISVAQLKVTSFINNLHPTRDRLFLDWFNSIYPSGKTDEFAAITHRWLLGRKSLSPDQLLAEDTEASTFAQTKFDVDSHAFISKLGARTSGSDQLIAAIKAPPTLRPAIAKAFAATTTATKATSPAVVQHDSAPATQPTRICTTIDKLIGCGIAFIPASNRYKF